MTGSTSQNSQRIRNRIRAEQRKRARKRRNSQGSPDASSGNDLSPLSLETGGGGQSADTALFERRDEIRSDGNLIKRGRREGWQIPPTIAARVVEKISDMVLTEKMNGIQLTPTNVLQGAVFLQNIERMNQSDEHHQDRMSYHERSLEFRGGEAKNPDLHLHLHATPIETQHRRIAAIEAITAELAIRSLEYGNGSVPSIVDSDSGGVGSEFDAVDPR